MPTVIVPEPLVCSQGGVPINKAHLDARDNLIERLQSRLAWRHEKLEGDRDHIIRQDGNWTFGVTERADGTWSSVWMEAGRAVHSRQPPVDVRKLVTDA